jgi:hypothetical protein
LVIIDGHHFSDQIFDCLCGRVAEAHETLKTIPIACRRGLQLSSIRTRCRVSAEPGLDQHSRGSPEQATPTNPISVKINGQKARH